MADEDFDGVIGFDEAHEMGGVAGGEGRFGATRARSRASSGVLLQNRLPARSCSTPRPRAPRTSTISPMPCGWACGGRNGLQRPQQFIARIRKGGIAAMELVARDLKAMGLYTARALSFAGVEYDILEHALTRAQIAIYDAYADAWAILCAAAHKIAYREVAIMRRNAA
jgi:hypothetical protein